jgi:SRSO17 transposase
MTKAREPVPTVAFVDDYCAHYRAVFPNVRQFEQFTRLALGLVAETKRKSLPRLAQTAKADSQAFQHFLAEAAWSVEELRARRLDLTHQALRERPFILCSDETGDRKKGKTTDYAASQYIGNVGSLANGVVSVNAYGVLDTVTFPLAFRIYKPQHRLKPGDVFTSKPQLAVELIGGARGARLALQRRARRQPVRRELGLHDGFRVLGPVVCGGDPLQSRGLDVSRRARAPDALAAV